MSNILQELLIFVICTSALLVLTTKNHVHSVMFLILVFICAAAILLFFGAEFISFIFIIVYVGAIAVLFLFIVMMLDIKTNKNNKKQFNAYIPFLGLLLILALTHVATTVNIIAENIIKNKEQGKQLHIFIDNVTNTELIGQYLYSELLSCFLLCGILLLIAMIGAIVLTQNFSSKRTNELTTKQLARNLYPFFLLK